MELFIGILIGYLIFSSKIRGGSGIVHCKYPTYERPPRVDRRE